MPIVVFDIDGTLTDTMDVDVECYEAAILSELGVRIPDDWPDFAEVTDPAILATACERRGVPVPDADAEARLAALVGELLASALIESPDRFRPIPGARGIFAHLERAGWRVAMATGAWRPSALVKLGGAGIPHDDVPLATASEHPARAGIIRHAVRALNGSIDDARDDTIVYVGDGVWDGRAAKSLGYGFVGVGQGRRAAGLAEAGADGIVSDFVDPRSFLALLEDVVS